jgi:hypothetical protein
MKKKGWLINKTPEGSISVSTTTSNGDTYILLTI